MKLIEFDGMNFKVSDKALFIRPIRELFRKDKSKTKEEFWRQMSYLWFMCDPRSTYLYITDEKEREKEIIKQEGLGDSWKPSALLLDAMEIYKKHLITTQSLLLEDMRSSIEDARFILRKLGEQVRNENASADGAVALDKILPVLTKSIKEIPELARALVEAEKALAKDFTTDDKARGTAEKALGEDL